MKRAPKDLKSESKKFWIDTLRVYELEAHHLKILEAACRCWDRILEARETVNEEGSYFIDRYEQPKPHPGLDVETKNKNLFMRLIRELCLDLEQPKDKDSRSPRLY
jgi:phage terminase small subunit